LTKNVKTRGIANILKTAGNIAKSLESQSKGFLQGMVVIIFKLYRKKLSQIFKVVKMNFGSKFAAKVSFHTS